MTVGVNDGLDAAMLDSLEDLLSALDLRAVGEDRFALVTDTATAFGRVFGGQLLAQAVTAASATVEVKGIRSLHATFVEAGTPGAPVEVVVTRLRDGRSLAVRQVAVLAAGAPLLVAIASFGGHHPEPDIASPRPDVASPEETPRLQEWAGGVAGARHWIDRPPAVDVRLPEAPSFLTGASGTTARSHWMRLPRSVGDDDGVNAALLAYASDFFLMDMIFRMHPDELGPGRANGLSLDHAIWFHRPVRFDDWHLHTQEAVALVGDRGLARGAVHDTEGRLVASVAQEVLLRPGSAR
ncbi:MAG TPA: acyl-CoA thioesterase domain-containing protein [Acidimicrobiales bacterium]|nr:acyl-CoA thioesterase domain-containing protein [Acidimicrobiales bacterium]